MRSRILSLPPAKDSWPSYILRSGDRRLEEQFHEFRLPERVGFCRNMFEMGARCKFCNLEPFGNFCDPVARDHFGQHARFARRQPEKRRELLGAVVYFRVAVDDKNSSERLFPCEKNIGGTWRERDDMDGERHSPALIGDKERSPWRRIFCHA